MEILQTNLKHILDKRYKRKDDTMNIDIRSHIKKNFKDSSTDDIKNSIEESIKEQEEITLPGLGVLFEILWQNSNNHEEILECIKKGL